MKFFQLVTGTVVLWINPLNVEVVIDRAGGGSVIMMTSGEKYESTDSAYFVVDAMSKVLTAQ